MTITLDGTAGATIDGGLSFNGGYGSAATAYGCRAWVNFDGTTNVGGFCTIRGSGNVTSVADNGAGNYTVNFTNIMPDGDYAIFALAGNSSASSTFRISSGGPSAANFTMLFHQSGTAADSAYVFASVFR